MNAGIGVNGSQFEANAVPPGEYILTARTMRRVGGEMITRTARVQVAVTNSDVNNLVLRLTDGIELTGRLRAEEGSLTPQPGPPAAAGQDQQPLRGPMVSLIPIEPNPVMAPRITMNSDGSFIVKGAEPGRYLVEIGGVRGYIKSIHYGGSDVTGQPLDLTADGELEVVISTKTGALDIQWPSRLPEPKAGDPRVMAVLWPAKPDRSSAYGGVLTVPVDRDGIGKDMTKALTPGEYNVAVFEEPPGDVVRIPDFLAYFNSQATRVTVRAGQEAAVQPGIISRESSRKALAEFP
jgi:hypothetical protein